MDPIQTSGTEPVSGAPSPTVEVSPMGEGWAPGVSRVPVSSGSRRLRWGIAGAIVMCVVLVTAGGFYVLSGAAGAKSLTAGVAPKNTVAFVEIRTDLPGDQHAKLADFMSHFPGFMDRSQFNTGLDELLNRITRSVSPDLTYTSAFKPWMEGEVSIAVTNIGSISSPTMMSGPVPAATPTPCGVGITPCTTDLRKLVVSSFPDDAPGVVVIVALKDHDAAKTWVANELTKSGVATTASQYAGTTLYQFGTGLNASAYALTDQDLLLGTPLGVEAALDSRTAGSLADNPNYQAAMSSLSGDSLARFYFDPATIVNAGLSGMSSMMGGLGGSSTPNLTAQIPAWVAGNIRADSGQLVVNVVMPRSGAAQTSDNNHVSRLAGSLPASTVLVTEVHGLGSTLTTTLSAAQKQMPNDSSISQIQNGLAMIGGLDWLGDGSVVVTKNGTTYDGGVVVEATDATTAGAKVALLHNILALAGSSLNVTSRSDTYKGVDITLIHVASTPDSTTGGLDVAVAAKDNMILAGVDESFVKSVIDTTSATSLASQPDYSTVLNAVGSSNSQSLYVNVPALEDQIGQALFEVSPSRWTLDYKPYFDHLGGVGYAVTGGNTVILRFIVTAK